MSNVIDSLRLDVRTLASLGFVSNRFIMKLFSTSDMEIIAYCGHILTLNCRVLF